MLHSLPSVTAPVPPIGFSVRLTFNPSIRLSPIVVYQCAMELMAFLAALPWTFPIESSVTMAGEDAPTEVFLDRWPPSGDSKMQAQHVILGLYQAGVAIARGNSFTQLNAVLYMKELKIGWFEFRPERAAQHGSSEVEHLTPLNSAHAYNRTAIIMADSGRIPDPYDKKFFITYQWDGVRIKAQDIFTVMLDGFAIAAEHNNSDLDAYIPAARSASGETVLSTWTVGEKGNQHMTWSLLKKALFLVWDSLILGYEGNKVKFEGVTFGLEYEGQAIGAGRMLRFDTDGQSVE